MRLFSVYDTIAGTLGSVIMDTQTSDTDVTKCTTGEAWSVLNQHQLKGV